MPYSDDPRASYIKMEMNMTWVEMRFNDLGRTLEYQGDADNKEVSECRLGFEIEKKVKDYIQREIFWGLEEATQKYAEFSSVWELIEDVVYEFAKKYPDRLWIKKEDEVGNECSYCDEQSVGNYGEENTLMCKEHRDLGNYCGCPGHGKKNSDECDCDETVSESE